MIRNATLTDVAQIATLVQRYWEFESIAGFERTRVEALVAGLLSHPAQGACWVAATEGGLCGYLLAVYLFSLEHGGMMAEIDEVFVSPEARSAGIGTELLARAELDLAAQGFSRLQLQLAVGNRRGRTFYEARGFSSRSGYELLDKPLV